MRRLYKQFYLAVVVAGSDRDIEVVPLRAALEAAAQMQPPNPLIEPVWN